jgi:hypothetical protein
MSYQPHYIAPFEQESGLNTYYEPFIIPEKAFPILEDAYIFRGRVKRRPGYSFLGRLRRTEDFTLSDQTDGSGTYSYADILDQVRSSQPNAEIQAGKVSIIISLGNVDQTNYTDDGLGNLIWLSGPYTIQPPSTINYITGQILLTFLVAPGASISVDNISPYYPTLPVMGLRPLITTTLEDDLMIAFDTIYAYLYNVSTNLFNELPSSTPTTFTGADYNFFWSTNYWSTPPSATRWLWVTNDSDPIYYYDQITWTSFQPKTILTLPATYSIPVNNCLIILSYQNRLILMNTVENGVSYPQRIRWSWIGNPIDPNAWVSNQNYGANFADLTTQEAIVSAEFIKDQLIIKCERSTWKLQFNSNDSENPFIPQKINTELGAEATFSMIPFDRGIFSVGNYGITVDDSVNVSRIDQVIPDLVFGMSPNNNGLLRIQGIRDYNKQLAYWTYRADPDDPDLTQIYPNQTLCYNYVNQTWSTWNDYYTCFGYFQTPDPVVWESLTDFTWAEWIEPWANVTATPLFPNVAAGNAHGFVLILEDQVSNDMFYQISAISTGSSTVITVNQHNFGSPGEYCYFIINGIIGVPSLNGNSYQGVIVDNNTITLYKLSGLTFILVPSSGTYIGGGTLQPLNGIDIWTKVFVPFYQDGSQCRLGYIDYLLDKTTAGELTCNVYKDENDNIPINQVYPDAGNTGTTGYPQVSTAPNSYVPWQQNQNKIWQRQFIQNICQNFQIEMTLNPIEMVTPAIQGADITLHAMALYLSKNGRLTQ